MMKYRGVVLLLLLTGVLAVASTMWVGGETIYAARMEEKRLFVHRAILENRIPEGRTWDSYGANGLNIRIAVPHAVELAHGITGVGVLTLYKLVDLVGVFVLLNLYFLYLRRWFDVPSCLVATLFLGALLPLTYLFHAFHPWDRPSCVLWLALLILLRDQRFVLFTLALFASVFVKFDTLLVPLLYWLCRVTRERFWRTSLEAAGLLALVFGTYHGLRHLFPGGVEPRSFSHYVGVNLRAMLTTHIGFPPLLVFGIPTLLAVAGWRTGDRFQRATAFFALPMCGILFLMTNFIEVRAEMPLYFLLSPLALAGLKRLLEPEPAAV